mgnify:CR=1 FL=1|tara:strand:- start:252 stop:584 length:333 start_codon:yes stop_codon:yes gene_type:complete
MSISSRRARNVRQRVITKIIKENAPNDYKLVNLDNLECCVCQGNDFLVKTSCHHFICLECFCNLQKPECPITRKPFENVPDKIKIILPWYQLQQTIEYNSSPNMSESDEV